MNPRKLFVAGSTGAVGSLLVKTAQARGIAHVPLVRPATAARGNVPPAAAVVELSDRAALASAMAGCSTVLQLIGTMRKRFKTGDTYETSDIGTTRQLVEAARDAGVDHLVLLSSVGAGKPLGAYLKAKAQAERLVVDCGIPFTILRPSAFMGAGHNVAPPFRWVAEKLRWVRYQPIRVEDLVDALLEAGLRRAPLNRALEGEALWELVRASKRNLAAP
ncbi:MAG: NAD(P)H-binding protein [Myxococcota bacterium]|nr:NAD(P)H-binding protein [Myxococcota bacterium]